MATGWMLYLQDLLKYLMKVLKKIRINEKEDFEFNQIAL